MIEGKILFVKQIQARALTLQLLDIVAGVIFWAASHGRAVFGRWKRGEWRQWRGGGAGIQSHVMGYSRKHWVCWCCKLLRKHFLDVRWILQRQDIYRYCCGSKNCTVMYPHIHPIEICPCVYMCACINDSADWFKEIFFNNFFSFMYFWGK